MNTWAGFVKTTHENKFIRFAFLMNEGIWIHMIGGGILAKIIHYYLTSLETILVMFGVAVLWEIIEIYIETPTKDATLAIYGSMERYYYDTVGDILGVVIITALIVF